MEGRRVERKGGKGGRGGVEGRGAWEGGRRRGRREGQGGVQKGGVYCKEGDMSGGGIEGLTRFEG